MIERIAAENFRRLKSCDIEIRDGITVLSGPNGTGKSTVIETACFCLYGKVKSGTKKDSIRRNNAQDNEQTRTSVDFRIDDEHYRCVRSLTTKGSTVASLSRYTNEAYKALINEQVSPFDQAESGTQLGTSATGTTAAVSGLLGVDYDGFCASFISQQKELDALASLTPEARKRFFLDLLGFSKLDSVKPELSREMKTARQSIEIIAKQNYDIKEIKEAIETTEKEIEKADAGLAKGRVFIPEVKSEVEKLSREFYATEELSKRCREGKEKRKLLEPTVAELEAKSAALKEKVDAWNPPSWFDEASSVYDALSAARQKLSWASSARSMAKEVEKLAGSAEIREKKAAEKRTRIIALEKETAIAPDTESARSKANDAEINLKDTRRKLAAEKTVLASIEELLGKVEAGEGVVCPTCASEMSSTVGKRHLEQEKQVRHESVSELMAAVECQEEALSTAKTNLATEEGKLRTYESKLASMSALDREASELEELAKATRETDIAEKRVLIEEIKNEASQVGFDVLEADLESLEREVAELEKAIDLERATRVGLQAHREAVSEKKETDARLASVKEELSGLEAFLDENAKAAEMIDETREKLEAAKIRRDKYEGRLIELEREKAAKEASLEALFDKLSKAKEQGETLQGLRGAETELKSAALVVDHMRKDLPSRIAPMLSQEASCILDSATDGAYSLLDIDEGYDVRVFADDAAMPLSQMSGGESDIIALSIRIAIAQMILEATGSGTQTMILDEIFGALDDGRKQSTCKALENLHSVLPRILCVSHVDEIKEMADWTYVVERCEDGDSVVKEVEYEVPLNLS